MGFKDLDAKKKKMLGMLIPAFLVGIIGMVVFAFMFSGGDDSVSESDPFARLSVQTVDAVTVPLLDKEDAYRKQIRDSVELANRDESINFNRYDEKRKEDSLRKAEAERKRKELFASMGLEDDDDKDKSSTENISASPVAFEEPTVPKEEKPEVAQASKGTSSNAKKSGGGSKKGSSNGTKSSSKKSENQDSDDGYGYYGFGVSSSKSNVGQNASAENSKKNKFKEQKFFEAFLIQDTRMKNGSQVTFILNQDVVINGIKFRKMSRIYGVCQFGSNVVNIQTTTIQNTDGKKYPLTLMAYNENYQQGIFVSGIESVVNEGTNETEENLIDEINPNSKLSVVNTGVKALARTTKKAVKREQEISMSEGYKMYFPMEEEM